MKLINIIPFCCLMLKKDLQCLNDNFILQNLFASPKYSIKKKKYQTFDDIIYNVFQFWVWIILFWYLFILNQFPFNVSNVRHLKWTLDRLLIITFKKVFKNKYRYYLFKLQIWIVIKWIFKYKIYRYFKEVFSNNIK